MDLGSIREIWVAIPSPIKAAVGVAAGTLFGAWLTSRAQRRREIVDELRALRSLHSLTLVIANQCIGAKRQQIAPLLADYSQAKRDFDLYLASPRTMPFNVQFVFHDVPPINAPIGAAERLAFEKCDLGPRGLAAAAELRAAIEAFNRTTGARNELLDELRLDPKRTDQDTLFRYFGLRNPETRTVDERYSSMVEALGLSVNDGIFFARALGTECLRHANPRAKRFRWRFWKLPYTKLEGADWSLAIKENLIPADGDYAAWSRGFRDEVPRRWWQKLFRNRSPKPS